MANSKSSFSNSKVQFGVLYFELVLFTFLTILSTYIGLMWIYSTSHHTLHVIITHPRMSIIA